MATSYIENMQTNIISEITWNELYHADRTLKMPFQLILKDHEEPVFCDELVRIVPEKRAVIFGTWCGQPVVAKLLYGGRKAKLHLQRELSGIEALTSVNIPTPKLLFHGPAKNKRIQVLLFERIFDAKSLNEIWQNKYEHEDIEALLCAVTVELATQHVLGVTQTDLHFKNFLIKENKILTLDGGSIESTHAILERKPSLDNLALFFVQLGIGQEKLQNTLFQMYTSSRGWLVKKADVKFLNSAIKKWNEQRWLHYEKKIFRDCTAFAKGKKSSALIMYDRDYCSRNFLNFLAHPETVFSDPETEILKSGRSSTVVKIIMDDNILVVKRYNVKGIWHWLRRCLRPTRAAASWRIAQLFCLYGIPTAKPIAFIENRFFGLRGKSYFIMEYVAGENIGSYFANPSEPDQSKKKVAERVVTLLRNLAKLRVSHGDLKMANILIHHEHPILIDLDGVVEHPTIGKTKRGFNREIVRFMQNWRALPTVQKIFEKLFSSHE